ncbi:MAG: ferritin-like domain-containing protein [Elainella sp. Prado103]|jgi:rubrerythrin|nr:ferritin-like domain-containing protein [Elainella sp. Prado103]
MNPLTQLLHLVGSGAVAYISARNLRDRQTRPNVLAGFQLAEAGAVPFLSALSERASTEGDDWLAESLARHAQDERRHSQIFAHALKQLNKQVIDFSQVPERDAAGNPDKRRRSPFFEAYYRGFEQTDLAPQTIDWMAFFISTHILELDASKDFARMALTLPDSDPASSNLKKGLLSIAEDEKRHAAYLLEAAQRRFSYAAVSHQVDEWRSRKVDALIAMVGNLVQQGGESPSLVRDGAPVDMVEDMVEDTAELATV